MTIADFLVTYTDVLRAWGFCAGVVASGDCWKLIRTAVPKAMQRRTILGALWTLWHEGERWTVNGWSLVLFVAALILAGSGLPAFRLVGMDDHPAYLVTLFAVWVLLSTSGWAYAIYVSKRRTQMALAALLLITGLGFGASQLGSM